MIFADTTALYAVVVREDPHHHAASAVVDRAIEVGKTFLTTNYILIELSSLLQGRIGIDAVRSFQRLLRPAIDVVQVEEEDHERAMSALLASGSEGVSLVDWASFEVMRKLGLGEALCFDPEFARQGFQTLPDISPDGRPRQ